MEKEKILRINELSKKAKNGTLSEEEKSEQKALRDEYRSMFRANFTAALDNTYIIGEDGNKRKALKNGGGYQKGKEQ